MENLLQKLLNVPTPAPVESGSQIVPHAGQQLVGVPSVQTSQGQLVVKTDQGTLMVVPQHAQQQIIVPSFQEEPETLASTAMMAVIMLCVVMMMQTLSKSMMIRRLL
jgi:hypothetical protein